MWRVAIAVVCRGIWSLVRRRVLSAASKRIGDLGFVSIAVFLLQVPHTDDYLCAVYSDASFLLRPIGCVCQQLSSLCSSFAMCWAGWLVARFPLAFKDQTKDQNRLSSNSHPKCRSEKSRVCGDTPQGAGREGMKNDMAKSIVQPPAHTVRSLFCEMPEPR